ncbi:MAG: ComF family protein [Flavobacteriaceae bacterium]|nr:ComF family protein [Flavobacteriaceae bacterium]
MLNLLFPEVCGGCKSPLMKSELVICTQCRNNLPIACYHRTDNDTMKQVFYGRFELQNATALLQFQKKGITQELLHNLKYRGQHKISSFLGKWLGAELSEDKKYQSIEMVIPVPLHKQKLKKRGYNQVSGFGKEIAIALGVPFKEDVLLKVSKTSSQVFKKRGTRFDGSEIFTIQNPEIITEKHILLVDDIVTTGATLENCATELLKAGDVTLSVATMAIA